MGATTPQERQRARVIAQEYRTKGYEVIEQPPAEQLPDFLSEYRPDLLARKGGEAVVVEVKSRTSLAEDLHVRTLARALEAKPGWSLELVVVRDEPKPNMPEGAHPFDKEDVVLGLAEAEKLLELGFTEAALLRSWAASEATVRLLLEEDGIPFDSLAPLHLLMQAATNGVISREDYKLLADAVKLRNALAHGFKIIDLDSNIVKSIISVAKRLLPSA